MTATAPRPIVSRPPPSIAPEWGSRLLGLLSTTDHKTIGLMYLVSSFLYFFAGGFMAC
jgi:cytochrome c oxidase subunit 1